VSWYSLWSRVCGVGTPEAGSQCLQHNSSKTPALSADISGADINMADIISQPTLLAGRHYQLADIIRADIIRADIIEGRHFGADIMPWKEYLHCTHSN
jgi:hypothetical protein